MEERRRCKYFNASVVMLLFISEIHATDSSHKVKHLIAMLHSGFSRESIQTDPRQFNTRQSSSFLIV